MDLGVVVAAEFGRPLDVIRKGPAPTASPRRQENPQGRQGGEESIASYEVESVWRRNSSLHPRG